MLRARSYAANSAIFSILHSRCPRFCGWLATSPRRGRARGSVAHAADYIVGKLTGVYDVSDQSNVLKTGFDLIDFAWPPFIESELGIDTRRLPRVVRTGEAIARVSKECAAETGLDERMSIVAGMTDGCADQIASGARAIGDWNTVLGSTLIFKGMTRDLLVDVQGRVYCHRHPMGYWMPGGASNVGARALDVRFPKVDRLACDREAIAFRPQTSPFIHSCKRESAFRSINLKRSVLSRGRRQVSRNRTRRTWMG